MDLLLLQDCQGPGRAIHLMNAPRTHSVHAVLPACRFMHTQSIETLSLTRPYYPIPGHCVCDGCARRGYLIRPAHVRWQGNGLRKHFTLCLGKGSQQGTARLMSPGQGLQQGTGSLASQGRSRARQQAPTCPQGWTRLLRGPPYAAAARRHAPGPPCVVPSAATPNPAVR
jgi:hypothetical protein